MMLEEIAKIGVIGFVLGGIGIPVGALLVVLLFSIGASTIPMIISISVGITSSILLLDVLPTGAREDGLLITIVGVMIGLLFIMIIGRWVHGQGSHGSLRSEAGFLRSAFIIAVAVALHNFPVGIALGSSLAQSSSVSWGFSLVMVLHAIPEGIALGLPLLLAGIGVYRVFTYSIIVALPAAFGAIVGYAMGKVYESLLAILLAIAAGTILFVSFEEILKPALRQIGIQRGALGLIYGWLIGLFFLFTMHATHM